MAALWLDQYNPTAGLTRRKRYRTVAENSLNPALGGMKLKDLRKMHLQAVVNDMAEKGYAEKTMAELKQIACQILEMAVENDFLGRNVFLKVKVSQGGSCGAGAHRRT